MPYKTWDTLLLFILSIREKEKIHGWISGGQKSVLKLKNSDIRWVIKGEIKNKKAKNRKIKVESKVYEFFGAEVRNTEDWIVSEIRIFCTKIQEKKSRETRHT